jgi:hypothetical protein
MFVHCCLKSPDFGRDFLLPKDDICNMGEVVVFSSQVDASVGYWQETAGFLFHWFKLAPDFKTN